MLEAPGERVLATTARKPPLRIRGPTIIGTKTYAKRQLPKRVLPVPQEREEGGVPPSGSNR
jgi:hypothetical protein